MREQILEFITANPGTRMVSICAHVGRRSCDRLVDQCLQRLRRKGVIEFRKGCGWFLRVAKERTT